MNLSRRRLAGLVVVLLVSGAGTMGWCKHAQAGNARMVKQSVLRLDATNKEAVQGIPDLPKNGTVALKARAFYQRETLRFDIEDITVTSTDETSDLFTDHQTGKDTKTNDSAKN